MEKITLELKTYNNIAKGYALIYPPSESEIWDCMLQNIPKNKKYLNHMVRNIWEHNQNYDSYKPQHIDDIDIPCGDITYYIDVYVESR